MAFPFADVLFGALYCGVALFLLNPVGNWACKLLLDHAKLTEAMKAKQALVEAEAAQRAIAAGLAPPAQSPSVGGLIGSFERTLLAVGILAGSWEVLAGVVALKTVARFKELDERLDAEYFLVGSLFSIAWAIAVTAAWIAFDRSHGFHLSVGLADVAQGLKGD